MTKDELVQAIAQKSGITPEQTSSVINAFTEQIKGELSAGGKVTISGFGTFVISKRKAKTFVNPKTGQTHELPERVLPHFRAGDNLQKNIRTV